MNKILEYQKLDIELNKLKRNNSNNAEKDNMNKLKGYIVEAQDKGIQLENNAKVLLKEYNELKKQYENNLKKVQELVSKDLKEVGMDEVDSVLSTSNTLSSELFLLERNINIILTKVKASLKEFEQTKNNIIKARQKFTQCKDKYQAGVKTLEPKIKEIEDKMKELEKTLNPELFAKYKAVKADKIFPVFVGFDNGHCSGCRVEIPTAKVNKLKSEGTIICEQCHRVIYTK